MINISFTEKFPKIEWNHSNSHKEASYNCKQIKNYGLDENGCTLQVITYGFK